MTNRNARQRSVGAMSRATLSLAALTLALCSACDDDDGGGEPDGSVADAGSGPEDSGTPEQDAGFDAGSEPDASVDGGVTPIDAGQDGGAAEDGGQDGGVDGGQAELVCNGSAELCDRPYNEVAFPATHNAMSSELEGFAHSDQYYGLARQLDDGIRAMEIDVWKFDPEGDEPEELYMCHGGACSPGRRKLSLGLADIADALEAHPNDVITILFEDHAPAEEILTALETAGLFEQLHLQAPDEEWPTLREMIDDGTRLVAFYENKLGNTPPYPEGYQPTWDYAWDTNWAYTQPSDFDDPSGSDCAKTPEDNRGSTDNPLFILNQMLDTDDQAEQFAMTVNLTGSLLTRAQKCQTKTGQLPNFIKVDYYNIGDLFSVVRTLNGLD